MTGLTFIQPDSSFKINKFKHPNKSLKLSTVGSSAFITDGGKKINKKMKGVGGGDCMSVWKSMSAGNGCRLKGHRCTGKLLLEGSCKS